MKQNTQKTEQKRPEYCQYCIAEVKFELEKGEWIAYDLDGNPHKCSNSKEG